MHKRSRKERERVLKWDFGAVLLVYVSSKAPSLCTISFAIVLVLQREEKKFIWVFSFFLSQKIVQILKHFSGIFFTEKTQLESVGCDISTYI